MLTSTEGLGFVDGEALLSEEELRVVAEDDALETEEELKEEEALLSTEGL